MCGVVWCYTGPPEQADDGASRRSAQFGAAGRSTASAPMPLPGAAERVRPLYPPGLQWYWKADFVKELTDEAIALHVEVRRALPTCTRRCTSTRSTARPAAWRRDDDRVQLPRRELGPGDRGRRPRPGATRTRSQRGRGTTGDALHPYSAGGAYVNMMMDEGEDRVRAAYRDNYDRLWPRKRRTTPTTSSRSTRTFRPDLGGERLRRLEWGEVAGAVELLELGGAEVRIQPVRPLPGEQRVVFGPQHRRRRCRSAPAGRVRARAGRWPPCRRLRGTRRSTR